MAIGIGAACMCLLLIFLFRPSASDIQRMDREIAEQKKEDAAAQAKRKAKEDLEDERLSAWDAAKDAVRDQLKSPSTAKFPWLPADDAVARIAAHHWLVSGHVDSENSFGAMLRADYKVELKRKSYTDPNWIVVRCALQER